MMAVHQPPLVRPLERAPYGGVAAKVLLYVGGARRVLEFAVVTGTPVSSISTRQAAALGLPVLPPVREVTRQTPAGPMKVAVRPPVVADVWYNPGGVGDPFRMSFCVFDDNPRPVLGLNAIAGCQWSFDGRADELYPFGVFTLADIRGRS